MIVISDTSAITALLQLDFIGLLGVLVQAKLSGSITSLHDILLELETIADFRLSEEVKSLALRKAGEL